MTSTERRQHLRALESDFKAARIHDAPITLDRLYHELQQARVNLALTVRAERKAAEEEANAEEGES